MPLKEWIQDLPDGFRLYVWRRTSRGRITAFSVALVFEDACIVRYDTAHGFAHRDVVGRKSALIAKESCENLRTEEAFHHAIDDLKTNFRQHLAFYLAH